MGYNPEQRKKYLEANKEKIKQQKKEYHLANREKEIQYYKEYRQTNKEALKIKEKAKLLANPFHKFKKNMRNLIGNSIRNSGFKKISRTEQILGCTFEEFKSHIESLWEPWMTWENRGNPKDGIYELNKTWDIDHIIPLTTAVCEADIIHLNHYTNLQPLCSLFNRNIKKDLSSPDTPLDVH